jgi:hypothetical protein
MIFREDARFEGFDADGWTALLALLRPDARGRQGTLLVAIDEQRRVLNACVLGRGHVSVTSPLPADVDLVGLCREHDVLRAVVAAEGAFEEVAERLALGMLQAHDSRARHADPARRAALTLGDDLQQLQALVRAVREVEDAGWLATWPPLPKAPLASAATARRALDLLLPVGHSFALVLYDDDVVSTGLALSRRREGIDCVVGHERILSWAGPLSGDYHRDHRVLGNAVDTNLAPLHLGVYGQRETLARLLRVPDPGAWVTAVAARELIVHPTPAYVGVALGADALRSLTRATTELLGGVELLELFRPMGRALREHLPEATSLTATLGWNPLAALARALRPARSASAAPRAAASPTPATPPAPADRSSPTPTREPTT